MEIRYLVRKVPEGFAVFMKYGKMPEARMPGNFPTRYAARQHAERLAYDVVRLYRSLCRQQDGRKRLS